MKGTHLSQILHFFTKQKKDGVSLLHRDADTLTRFSSAQESKPQRPFTTNVHSTYKPENELHGEDLAQAEAH